MSNTPPGWYPNPEEPGQQRWWDGAAWTANARPTETAQPAPAPPQSVNPTPQQPPPDQARPWYQKKRFLIPGALIALVIVAGIVAQDPEPDDSPESATTSETVEAEEPTEEEGAEDVSDDQYIGGVRDSPISVRNSVRGEFESTSGWGNFPNWDEYGEGLCLLGAAWVVELTDMTNELAVAVGDNQYPMTLAEFFTGEGANSAQILNG